MLRSSWSFEPRSRYTVPVLKPPPCDVADRGRFVAAPTELGTGHGQRDASSRSSPSPPSSSHWVDGARRRPQRIRPVQRGVRGTAGASPSAGSGSGGRAPVAAGRDVGDADADVQHALAQAVGEQAQDRCRGGWRRWRAGLQEFVHGGVDARRRLHGRPDSSPATIGGSYRVNRNAARCSTPTAAMARPNSRILVSDRASARAGCPVLPWRCGRGRPRTGGPARRRWPLSTRSGDRGCRAGCRTRRQCPPARSESPTRRTAARRSEGFLPCVLLQTTYCAIVARHRFVGNKCQVTAVAVCRKRRYR